MSRSVAPRPTWHRIDASTLDCALDAINALGAGTDVNSVCAVLAEDDVSRDDQVALVSVLVLRGVRVFETANPQAVTRILDTHAALSIGQIEVLK